MPGTAGTRRGRATQAVAGCPRCREPLVWFGIAAIAVGTAQGAAAQGVRPSTETPNRIVEQAERAIAADSGPAMAARWRARANRDSSDRLARFGIAVLAMLANDSADAARGFRGLEEKSAQNPEAARVAAYARWGEGSLFYSLGRWADAARSFDDASAAMRAVHDSVGEALSLIQLAWLEVRAHRPTATGHLARADSLIPPRDSALRGGWDCAHATILSAAHEPGAVEAADSGALLARRAGDLREAAQCEFSAVQDLAASGRINDAIQRLGEVIALSAESRDHSTHAAGLQWRGFAELNEGHYGPSERDLLAAVDESTAEKYPAGVGWSELNLAALADELGDAPDARRHAARSYAALSAIKDSSGLGILRRDAARRALAVGDTAAARSGALAALEVAEHHGQLEDVLGARIGLAAVDVREHRWDAAEQQIRTARQLLTVDRAKAWTLMLPWYEGRISLDRGRPQIALRQLAAAERVLDSTQHLFRSEIEQDMAVAWLRTGDTSRALAFLGRADGEVDTWRATLDDAGLRVLAFSATEQIPGGTNAEVIAAAVRSHRSAAGFALAERQRARELADQLLRMEALGSGRPGIASASRPSAGRGPGQTIGLTALQRALPDDSTALLEYVTGAGPTPTSLFLVTRQRAISTLVPPVDSLTETIERLNALVDQGVPASAAERALGAALLPDLVRLPRPIRRLVIVPDGALHRVPFSTLRLPDGAAVIDHFALSLAPSATVATTQWRHPPVAGRTTIVLAFGDPVLPDSSPGGDDTLRADRGSAGPAGDVRSPTAWRDTAFAFDRDAASALATTGQLPRLPWTADEAALVGAFGEQATVRLRGDASAAFLERAPLDAFSVIHFATHAVVDEDVPARSALALAPGGGQSGYVGPSDLAALHLTADLVVLSACRTARGAVVTGEGVRGFTAPLLEAGARSVLATQWGLNDRNAVPLVYAVYREIADGLPLAEAVRRAELAARRAGRPEREWAAFILIGDPLTRVPLRVPPPDRVPAWVRRYEMATR